MILLQIHVILVVPFPSLKAHGQWSSQLFNSWWAWVGQVLIEDVVGFGDSVDTITFLQRE